MATATNQNQHRAGSPGLEGSCSDRRHARNSPHEDNVEKMTLCSTNQPLLKSRLIDQNVRKILLTKISEKFKGVSTSSVEFLGKFLLFSQIFAIMSRTCYTILVKR
jgi:hypothetical protein